jgi:hypothetical protein
MTADILPHFTGGTLDAVARAFQRSPATLWPDREVREGAAVFGRLRSILSDEREAATRELREGVEASSFVARHQPAADGLAHFFAVASEMRTALAEIDKNPGAAELIAEVEAAEAEAVALRQLLADAFRKAAAPFPKLDWKKLEEETKSERAAGRLKRWATMEDMISDLSSPE